MWPTFLSLCLALSGKAPRRPARRRRPAFRRPLLEALEDRCLLSAGALDPTFGNGAGYVTTAGTNAWDAADAVLIQPDGKIVAAGNGFNNSKGGASSPELFTVARYNPTGSLDTSFGSGGTAVVSFGSRNGPQPNAYGYAAALQADGKIVLSGAVFTQFKNGTTQSALGLARLNANGTLDTTFGNLGKVTTSLSGTFNGYHTDQHDVGVVVQPDGKIVAVEGSTNGFELYRYNPNGSLDATFGSGGKVVTALGSGNSYAATLLLQPDGKLIVSGEIDTSSGFDRELARYNANGSLDTSFGTGGIVSGPIGDDHDETAALYPSGSTNAGKIVVDVRFLSGPGYGYGLARYNPDGTLDSTFGTGGEVHSTGLFIADAIAADGKIVVVGDNAVLRFNADGSVDNTFGTGGTVTTGNVANGFNYFRAVALQSNGDIVAAGNAGGGPIPSPMLVARFLPSEPEIGSFTASASTVTGGSSVTLTASNITDGNPGATVTQVAFYAQVNNTNTLLGYGTPTSPGVWTFSFTVSLAPGTYTLFAQAEDSFGVFGDLAALTLQVN
jgi:uncharacterized delta-60 repeat protein